jgi:invasion protein IalB
MVARGETWGTPMPYSIFFESGVTARRAAVAAVSALMLAAAGFSLSSALAQQRAQAPRTAKPPAAQAHPSAPQQIEAPAALPDTAQLIYSPWAKFCVKDNNEPNAKEVCMTGKDGRLEDGRPVVGAALFESEGEPKKLRVTLPMPVQIPHGARIVIDKAPALTAGFSACFPNGCMAEFEGTADLIGKLKKGQTLNLQAINLAGNPFSFPLPLVDDTGNSFAKANQGPPIDPKVFEEKKLREEPRNKGLYWRD